MIPYMGLQAFDFCASALFVFALFSYLPYLRNWLLSLVSVIQHHCTHWLSYCVVMYVVKCISLS